MGSQLASKSGHVAVQCASIAIFTQNCGGQVFASDCSSSSFDQMEEEHPLGAGERHGAVAAPNGTALGIDLEFSPGPCSCMAVAHALLDTRHQFCHKERLWDVVIGTGGEALKPRIQVRPSRHHDQAAAKVPNRADELKAIPIRETKVQDHTMRPETLQSSLRR